MPSPHSDGFSELVRASDKNRNAALLRATTELYALDVDHNLDQNRRFEELTSHLLPNVSLADRIFVAERLADLPDAPVAILRSLALDDIEVARPVLTRSVALGAFELLFVLASAGEEHRRLVAGRQDLPEEVRQALVIEYSDPDHDDPNHDDPGHDDPENVGNLDGMDDPTAFMARDIAPDAAMESSAPADQTMSTSAQIFLDMDRGARLRAIASIASGGLAGAPGQARATEAFDQIVSTAQIIGFARAQQPDQMIAAIARSLDLSDNLVRASLNDTTGEPLAILLKALRLDHVTAQQVFLIMSPVGTDTARFFPLSDLFSGMEWVVADAIVARWRDSDATPIRHETQVPDIPSRRETRMRERQRPAASRAVPFGRAKRA